MLYRYLEFLGYMELKTAVFEFTNRFPNDSGKKKSRIKVKEGNKSVESVQHLFCHG